ncbi:MAG: magnesium-translocating P-type ATPase [Saprospiraceae bacterium]|nr:magnesium-translocating P-type ATPase [Saprospiraceae bacterium]MDW8228826.1 magnesium-translocating P-type ATPase [Saprospiraceae bacterium]
MTNDKDAFWQFESAYWFQQLNTSENGLSQQAARDRLLQRKDGGQGQSAFRRDFVLLLHQFKSPLVLLLMGASIISAFLGDYTDASIMLAILLLTGLLSFLQERNAGKVAERLRALITLRASVLRDGACMEIPAHQVVPGDVLMLKAGDLLPADCLILESNELHANEASLTGESYPVSKEAGVVARDTPLAKRANCLWEGSSIVSGNARALVIRTGADTLFGNLRKSAEASPESAFEKGIRDFGFFLLKVTLTLTLFILLVNLFNEKGVIESALFALALSVGMAPELLPAITTIAMSAGARRMLEKKVIVKKLNAIQNLGEVNLLCTDKTGTITEGAVRIAATVDSTGQDSAFVRKLAFWNASFESGYTNPIDEALKALALPSEEVVQKIGEIPYDFIRKRLSIGVETATDKWLITKGAFSQVLDICTTVRLASDETAAIAEHRQALIDRYDQYGSNGMRVLALAYKRLTHAEITRADESEMVFAGFILVSDPVKRDILETIETLKRLSIDLKIITGDSQNVARAIAVQLGIRQPEILTGKQLEAISPEALPLLARKTHIFAEVEPQQKERIILALKKFYTVAYMGDGINDVSALRAADVGISVENAVDVAREAADFVLMEQNLMVLAEGVEEGRKTFANTMKYIYINTGSTFGNMFSVSVASLMLPFLPMLPKQILLVNFLTSFPFLTVSADNVDEEQLMRPGRWNIRLLRRFMVVFGLHSSLFDIMTFVTLFYILKTQASVFQTGWFIESICTQLIILFVVRTRKQFFKSRPGKYLLILSIAAFFVTVTLPYTPLAWQLGMSPLPIPYLLTMVGIAALYGLTGDWLKVWFFRSDKHVEGHSRFPHVHGNSSSNKWRGYRATHARR